MSIMAEAGKRTTSRRQGHRPAHAVGVDAEIKASNLRRLKRIEGQVRGVMQMIEDDRYCVDVLTQIAAIREGLRAVGRETMRNHLKHCVSQALKRDADAAESAIDEVLELVYKSSR
jgi:DNA-binding FrmR family transcriptional regulator